MIPRTLKSLLLTFAFGGLIAVQTAHAQTADAAWAKIQEAAKKEGRVVLYSDMVPAVFDALKADFEKANPGIIVENARLLGPVQVNKMDEERKANIDGGDVVIGTEVLLWYSKTSGQGLLAAPVGPAAKTWPSAYLLGGMVPILALEPLTISYNTDIIKEPITSYQDLLKPQYKGKMGVSEPVAAAVVAWYDWLEKTQGGPDYLAKLAAQTPRLYVGAVPTTQAAASGEAPIAAFSNPTTTKPLIAQGAPLKLLITNPAFGIRYAGAIAGWSHRPNAAQVFMDYLMSARGQTTWSGPGVAASPRPNIPGALDINSITPYDPTLYNGGSVAAYQSKWAALFKKAP